MRRNKAAYGADKMVIKTYKAFLASNLAKLSKGLMNNEYLYSPVKLLEIPKGPGSPSLCQIQYFPENTRGRFCKTSKPDIYGFHLIIGYKYIIIKIIRLIYLNKITKLAIIFPPIIFKNFLGLKFLAEPA
ncbi:MAG: hypothetical protein LBP22_01435 [Deltaproteobacteria bacterium]|nr:hypothetical protein [Deltaproteobacteria bacterium]